MRCPHHAGRLRPLVRGELRSFACGECGGRAVTLSALRRAADPKRVAGLWRQVFEKGVGEGPGCPACSQPMLDVKEPDGPPLDMCRRCQLVWFDADELESLARPEAPEREVNVALEQALVSLELQKQDLAERRERGRSWGSGPPEDGFRATLAMFGVPFEEGLPEKRDTPWLTWALSAALVLAFAATVSTPALVDRLGLVPEAALSNLLVPWLAHGLLHEDFGLLILDVVLLLLFADDVECALGRGRFVALMVAATLFGGLAHAALDPFPEVALVGCTAAATAALVVYVMRFPEARVGTVLDFRRSRWSWSWYSPGQEHLMWVRVPAWIVGLGWLLVLSLWTWMRFKGETDSSGLSGLGGALVGLIAALGWGFGGRR